MSGGGSSRGGGPPSGGPQGEFSCDTLSFKARLQSPRPEVVGRLSVDDELRVELTDDPAVRVVSAYGTAGHITTRLPDLIHCINLGYTFVAVVEAVDGGDVVLRVQPAS